MLDQTVTRLRVEVLEPLTTRFVERGEVVDLLALAVVAGEHLFLYGPPGTAKSALIREFAQAVRGRYFEYMLTRFSEPNEIFGPIDIGRLREGVVATVTTGMLPEAEFAFLDELFNANSAILNNLLTVLNERVYRRAPRRMPCPCSRCSLPRTTCRRTRRSRRCSIVSCCVARWTICPVRRCRSCWRPAGSWSARPCR